MELVWSKINEIYNFQDKQDEDQSKIKIRDKEGNLISDLSKISERFNEFFVNIAKGDSTNITNEQSYLSLIPKNNQSFYLRPITTEEISYHIQQLKTSKSVRPEDPSIKFIKRWI